MAMLGSAAARTCPARGSQSGGARPEPHPELHPEPHPEPHPESHPEPTCPATTAESVSLAPSRPAIEGGGIHPGTGVKPPSLSLYSCSSYCCFCPAMLAPSTLRSASPGPPAASARGASERSSSLPSGRPTTAADVGGGISRPPRRCPSNVRRTAGRWNSSSSSNLAWVPRPTPAACEGSGAAALGEGLLAPRPLGGLRGREKSGIDIPAGSPRRESLTCDQCDQCERGNA